MAQKDHNLNVSKLFQQAFEEWDNSGDLQETAKEDNRRMRGQLNKIRQIVS